MILAKLGAILKHRTMWHWIADETRKKKRKVTKKEYFDYHNIPYEDRPLNLCFCCEYDESDDIIVGRRRCEFCPIDWCNDWGNKDCNVAGSLFKQWLACNDKDWKRAAKLADKIAELPERSEVPNFAIKIH